MSRLKNGAHGLLSSAGILRPKHGVAEAMTADSTEKISIGTAAIYSAIVAAAGLFTIFLPQWTIGTIRGDAGQFGFSLFVYLGGQFFTSFVSILGLAALVRK